MGCNFFRLGDFRDQKVDLGTWILFYHQAQTHSLMEKKTRNPKSKNKILYGRPTFLVHVQNWEKIIAETVKTWDQLWGKISQRSEGAVSPDFDRIYVPQHTFEFFENLMWISHILAFFCFDFQSHRSQSLEGAERAKKIKMWEIHIRFSKNLKVCPGTQILSKSELTTPSERWDMFPKSWLTVSAIIFSQFWTWTKNVDRA